MWTISNIFLTPTINARILYGGTCHFASDHLILHIASLSWQAPLLPTQLLLLLVVVMMLDLLNAEVLEGTELNEVGGKETILTQHSHHQNDSAVTAM